MARMKRAATKGFTLPEMIPRTISTTSKKTMKAGAKGASIPYEPRRREVTRLVIRHLPGGDEAGGHEPHCDCSSRSSWVPGVVGGGSTAIGTAGAFGEVASQATVLAQQRRANLQDRFRSFR